MVIKNYNFILIFIGILLLGFFFRYHNNFYEGFWSDEILTLIISNPSNSQEEMIKNWWKHDGSPIIYFYLVKYYLYLFGFSPENIRSVSIIFSFLTILISFKFFSIRYKNEFLLSSIFLLAINIFLIWQSKEARIPSTVSFFSISNIIFFYFFLKKQTLLNFILLFIFNLFLINYYPFTVTILFSQFLYLCFLNLKFKQIIQYSFLYLSIILIYIFLNYEYLQLHGSRGLGHIGVINYKFFLNYFFSSYFGTYFFGGISLILFAISFLKNLIKKIDKRDIIYFHILIVLNTYLFLILYTLFKTEIAVPRYFIFLIPSIIFIIIDLFKSEKLKKYLYLFLVIALANSFYGIQKGRIPKPPIKELVSNLSLEKSKIILHNEEWFDIYLENSKKINRSYKIINKKDAINYDKIWFVCFNNIRAEKII